MRTSQFNDIYSSWISKELSPNVYAVTTLKQSIQADGSLYRSWIRGDANLYAAAYDGFIRHLSLAVYGKRCWTRHKKLLPNAATLEGNGCGKALSEWHSTGSLSFLNGIQSGEPHVRYHLNMMFRRPDWIPLDDFKTTFCEVWRQERWAMPDIFIEDRMGDCVSYSLKEGPEALLVNSMSF